eukprot:COSAG02_NODE_1939_length_10312_cov_14.320866_1_plen_50_part_10
MEATEKKRFPSLLVMVRGSENRCGVDANNVLHDRFSTVLFLRQDLPLTKP